MVKKKNKSNNSISEFKKEFKGHVVTAITAGFAFLLALTWREPLADTINLLIVSLGLSGQDLLFRYLSAIVFTIIAVFLLMLVAKWSKEE